ncbi:hypothetical protein AB0J57_18485 [Streptomyces sp. NPDC049837]|uniref:hypothetical protein n=1 Tax=Streptomyces sp. NPDC049837 TaxID=3155277 RepID=UPI00341592ED
MATIGAVATLLAALFVCLAPHGGAEGGQDRDRGHGRAWQGGADGGPDRDHGRGTTLVAMTPVATAEQTVSEYTCPYDRGDCRLFPYLTPAVLTAPPLDPPPHADGLVRVALSPSAGRPAAHEARPRAPDLHVLQVLRT